MWKIPEPYLSKEFFAKRHEDVLHDIHKEYMALRAYLEERAPLTLTQFDRSYSEKS